MTRLSYEQSRPKYANDHAEDFELERMLGPDAFSSSERQRVELLLFPNEIAALDRLAKKLGKDRSTAAGRAIKELAKW